MSDDNGFQINPALDRSHVRVIAPGAAPIMLDAAGLEALIHGLVHARAAIDPRRTPAFFFGARVLMAEPNAVEIEPVDDERTCIRLMHPGLGWVGSNLDRQEAENCVEALRYWLDNGLRPIERNDTDPA